MDKYLSFSELIGTWEKNASTALYYADPEIRTVSFRELRARILERAAEIGRLGTEVEAVVTDHSPDTVVRIFGDVIGGCDVILADPSVPKDALAAAAEGAKIRRAERKAPGGADPQRQAGSGCGDATSGTPARPEEGALLFFTSGTTSRSKAVVLTSRSLCASAWSGQSMLPCAPGDILLSVLPLSHVFGFVCSLLWGLAYGAAIALGRGVRHMVDDTLFFRPTILPAVPSLVEAMYKYGTLNPGLRVVLIGAAPCTPSLAKALREKGIAVYLGYGLTETSSGIAITQDPEEPFALYPCPGADIRIGPDGEISVATPCLMEGYLGENASGACGSLRDGRFYTGDLGSFDEKGRLRLAGRKKDVLLLPDGTKIFCPEYEAEFVAALGTPDVAVVLKNGHAALVHPAGLDPDLLAKTAAAFNAKRTRSQQIYDMIAADRPLPRTATGKLRRWELQQAAENGGQPA